MRMDANGHSGTRPGGGGTMSANLSLCPSPSGVGSVTGRSNTGPSTAATDVYTPTESLDVTHLRQSSGKPRE